MRFVHPYTIYMCHLYVLWLHEKCMFVYVKWKYLLVVYYELHNAYCVLYVVVTRISKIPISNELHIHFRICCGYYFSHSQFIEN